MAYPTSPLMTLSPSLWSFSGFTQPFTPFSLEPPGVWQVPLTPSRLPLLENPPLFSPSSSAFLKPVKSSLTFYTLKNSTMSSLSSLPLSLMLFSPLLFFHSQKANNYLSMQITSFPLIYSKPTKQPPPSPTAHHSQCQPKFTC